MESAEPELKYSKSGIVALILLFFVSILMIVYGYVARLPGLSLWGFVFFMGSVLALIPIFSRLFAFKVFVESMRSSERQKELEERIRVILKKHGELPEEISDEELEKRIRAILEESVE